MRLLVLALALVGCTAAPPAPPWASRAAQADEAGLWMASESALLLVPGNLSPRETPTFTARDAVMSAYVPFNPNDCLVATSHYGTVSYTLDDCSGPFGLVHATGHLEVTYLDPTTPGELRFHASTHDLVLNGGAVSFEADATVTHDSVAQSRTMILTIQSDGVGPSGTTFTRTGTQTAHWFDSWGCLFVDTSDDTLEVDGVSWQAHASALSFCIGECPMTGGEVSWTGAEGALTVTYRDTAEAGWSVAADPGQTGTIPVSCQGP